MGMLAKIRRMHFRDHLPLREIARQTGLSRNTIRHWLRKQDVVEPRYRARAARSVVDAWADQLGQWLNTDRHRPKRDRRTARAMFGKRTTAPVLRLSAQRGELISSANSPSSHALPMAASRRMSS